MNQAQCRVKAHAGHTRRRTPGTMTKLESAYALRLNLRKAAGEIVDWKFEAIKLRLAKRTYYTPDFFVMLADRTIEIVEVKGHWEDDARVKIKVAAEQFWWFTFKAVTRLSPKDGGGWKTEEF